LFPLLCVLLGRFAHGDNDQRDLAQLKRRAAGVCYNWKESVSIKSLLSHHADAPMIQQPPDMCFCVFSFVLCQGECKFGESCRFAHEDIPEKVEA